MLTLVDIDKSTTPAAFHEAAAARYVGMNRFYFRRDLVDSGLVPYTFHVNGKTRIYLRSDLDAYLSSLHRRTMVGRENPRPALVKGTAL